jgi:hypothetical protein
MIPILKQEWEELAIEWHLLANSAAQDRDEIQQIDIEAAGLKTRPSFS